MNTGTGLQAGTSSDCGLVRFDSDVNDAIEYGNIELPEASARIIAEGPRLFGLSGGAVTLPRYATVTALPSTTSPDLRLGAMVWVNAPETGQSQLRVLATKSGGGRVWRSVELT